MTPNVQQTGNLKRRGAFLPNNMAPVRRYLRISKFIVLETRIYLDEPALLHSWLLSVRDPALPKVITAVKPLVLPKLLEECERNSWKGSKKK